MLIIGSESCAIKKKYLPVCFHNEGNLIGHSASTDQLARVKMTFILRVHGRNVTEGTSLLLYGLNYAYFNKANDDSVLYFQGSLAKRQIRYVFSWSGCLITLQLSTLHLQFDNLGARALQKHDFTIFLEFLVPLKVLS